MKPRNRPIAGFPKEWSDYLLSTGFLNSDKTDGGYMLAGEDIKNNRLMIKIDDLPRFIKAGVQMQFDTDDLKLLKEYFSKL